MCAFPTTTQGGPPWPREARPPRRRSPGARSGTGRGASAGARASGRPASTDGSEVDETAGDTDAGADGLTKRRARSRATAKRDGRAPLAFRDLAASYLRHLESVGKSRSTVFSYSIDLGLAERAFGDETDTGAITVDQVREFNECDAVTKTRAGKPKSDLTVAKTRRVLRLALTWASENRLIDEAPIPLDALPGRRRKGDERARSTASNEPS